MRSFRHWTPRYICDRVEYWFYENRHPDYPWLTQTAVTILSSWLKPSDVGFEWGAGRSTIWVARRVRHLTSVEHDSQWHDRVADALAENQIQNADLWLRGLRGREHSEYVKAIDLFSAKSLDFVLVDGELRQYCVIAAIEKVRPGGLLVLDNAERHVPNRSHSPESIGEKLFPEWQSVLSYLSSWRCMWTSNGLWDTALFVKPVG